MIYLVPGPKPTNLTLIFSLPHSREIKSVCVAGTFNDFSESATPLRQSVANGPWEASVTVPRKSEVLFRYVINEHKRQFDPDVPATRNNPNGLTFSFITADLAPGQSSAPSSTASDAQLLLQMAPASLKNPKKRIALAESMLKQALKPELDPQDRLNLLQQAVSLDPFNTQIRLALGQVLQELGLAEEAVASLKQALELRPGEARIHLLMGEAQLAAGNLDEARQALSKVPPEGKPGRRAAYDLLEIDLRKAGDEDWKKILDSLTRLGGKPGEEGPFCEKCLKLLSEWEAPEAPQAILNLVNACYPQSNHPAVATIRQAAGYKLPTNLVEVNQPPTSGDSAAAQTLLRVLTAYRLARVLPAATAEDRVARLGEWRKMVEHADSRWPELRGAYLHQLSDWAIQAYKKKDFDLAATLWGEAGRVAPNTPVIQQNLAIVNTRLGEDAAQEWHWQQLTRTWTQLTELMPEADGYTRHIIQKHQAFVQGAEAKLPTMLAPEEVLELGALWMKEAAPLLALRQLSFRNPLYRCGVMTDDYVGKDERGERLEEGYTSTAALLRMSHEWLGLSDSSALAQKRLRRLERAYQAAAAGGDAAYRHYDEEKEAFKGFREIAGHQYLQLLFQVLLPSAEKLNLDDLQSRQRYAIVARGLMAFPHQALKPAVLKAVKQLEEDTDMQQLVTNYAIGPWFKRAQDLMQKKQADKAAPFLEEALQIAPNFTVGMFYLAQCRIEQKRWDDIAPLLADARARCKEGEELIEHIDHLLEQLPMIKIAEEFRQAQEFMKEEDWKHALDFLQYADQVSPDLVPVLFYTAVCHFRLEDWDEAEYVAKRALKLCSRKEDKDAKEQLETLIKQLPMARVAKSMQKAREFMDREQWVKALEVLDDVLEKDITLLAALFYKAVCHFRNGDWNEAEETARGALAQCGKGDKEIKEQLNTLLEQIPLARRAAAIKPITEAIEREDWDDGIETANNFLYDIGEDPVVLFYKALCLLRSGDRDSARDDATRALALAKGNQYADLRSQLGKLIEASSQPFIPPQFNKAVQAMERKAWREALDLLEEVLDRDNRILMAMFYKAVCHFRLEEWDEAEYAAQRANDLCTGKDKEIKDQIKTLLQQITPAKRAAAMKPVKDAVEHENWHSGIFAADDYLNEMGDDPVVLFYKALCQFRTEDAEGARETAEEARKLAGGAEYRDLRDQLNKLIEATHRGAHVSEMNKAVQALNEENWLEALGILYKITRDEPSNAQAHYYLALSMFQSTMDLIKSSHGITSSEARGFRSSMEMVISNLDDAEKHSSRSDRDLRKGINNLREAASNVLRQLRG